MKTSRQRVLEYVETQRAVTALEISHALKMTPANARHHLSILLEQGAIEVIGQRAREGKGRPTKVFGLARHRSYNNIHLLTSALLTEIQQSSTSQTYTESLERIARRLTAQVTDERPQSKHLTQRLYESILLLNKMTYQARWEAHSGAPRLTLENCPYRAIIDQHPEICQLDAMILKSLLNQEVVQLSKLNPDARGVPVCVFRIRTI